MDKRRLTETEEAAIGSELKPGQPPAHPNDTDDNDQEFADASGDGEDETPDENQAPSRWHKGEE